MPLCTNRKYGLVLAGGAVVGTAACEEDAVNGCAADQAGLSSAHVDAVFELEKTADAVGVNVVGD